MSCRRNLAHWFCGQIVNGVSRPKICIPTTSRTNHHVFEKWAYFRKYRRGGTGLLCFQGPLLFGSVDLAKVVDAGVHLGGGPRPNPGGSGNRRQQSDYGNHDAYLHQREACLVRSSNFHTDFLSFPCDVNLASGSHNKNNLRFTHCLLPPH